MEDVYNYLGYLWMSVRDGQLVIGISEEGLEEFSEILSIDLPSEGDEVLPDTVLGEIETDQGPMNIYCPFEGSVAEVNEAVLEKPALIMDDPTGDGWIMSVELNDAADFDSLGQATTNDLD